MARTMATTTERRAAAELRRRQAGEAGDRGGDAAYRQYRSAAPHAQEWRKPGIPAKVRAAKEPHNGREMFHTWGYFTSYERPYPMWDDFGEYDEVIARGAGRQTLASRPEVAFQANHEGITLARTGNSTLFLEERDDGGWHDAWLNPGRVDVQNIVTAIIDGEVEEMSFKFMIPAGAGLWTEDFMTFEIRAYDINRGDVSAVNFGANPHTTIAAQAPQILDAIAYLPDGALREASARLAARGGQGFATGGRIVDGRERIVVREPREVDPKASRAVRALQGHAARTADRFAAFAQANNLSVADIVTARLPWYEIRAQESSTEPGVDGEPAEPESTDVFIYDEIGGSMGVSAKKFAADLNAITTPTINIRINSPGGSVFEGEAIHSSILHKSASGTRIVGYADGIVASAGSLIFMACDERVVMPAGELMIHDASMTTEGNAADHGKGQTFLDRHSDHLADIYAERMGVTREEARQMMLDETWAFPDEAVTMGLADRVGTRAEALPTGDPAEERMRRSHDLTRFAYRYQGRSAAPAPRQTRQDPRPATMLRRVEFETEGADRAAAIQAEIEHKATMGERSTPTEPMGRSIASIEARVASIERS